MIDGLRTSKEVMDLCMSSIPEDKIQTRAGRGGSGALSYVGGEYVIGELCRIFGPEGWSSEIMRLEQTCPTEEMETRNGQRMLVCYTCVIKIFTTTSQHVDVGYGQGISRSVGEATESAMKEAVTDALKRAGRQLGWRLGLALYDKSGEHIGEEPEKPCTGVPEECPDCEGEECQDAGEAAPDDSEAIQNVCEEILIALKNLDEEKYQDKDARFVYKMMATHAQEKGFEMNLKHLENMYLVYSQKVIDKVQEVLAC